MSSVFALDPCFFKLVAFLPSLNLRLRSCRPSQRKSKARHDRVTPEVHAGIVFITGLVVALVGKFFRLFGSPLAVVAFVLHSFVDGERWDTNASHAEVIRAVVVASLRVGIRTDG